MIIPEDTKPEKSLYAIGANMIELMKKEPLGVYDVHVLYDKFLNFTPRKDRISFNVFTCAVTWLYLLGLVNLDENDKLKRCF